MGVLLFQKTYQACLEKQQLYFLEVLQTAVCKSCPLGPCERPLPPSKIDLTQRYTRSAEETPDREGDDLFIPDILLSNEAGGKMYVEIVVSHKASEKKCDAGIPILEIDINSEDDLLAIERRSLSEADPRVRIINGDERFVAADFSRNCERLAQIQREEREKAEEERNLIGWRQTVVDAYNNALQERLAFPVHLLREVQCKACEVGPCFIEREVYQEDLTRYFPEIRVEGERIFLVGRGGDVDLLIRGPAKGPTNPVSSINRGQRIIEFVFSCPGQSMQNVIAGRGMILHNFNPRSVFRNSLDSCRRKEVKCFRVLKSGRAWLGEVSVKEFRELKNNTGVLYYKKVDQFIFDSFETFVKEIENAFLEGIDVKNCYLCRYHTGNSRYTKGSSQGAIFCKYKKITCGSKEALHCASYKPNKKVIGTDRYDGGSKFPRKF